MKAAKLREQTNEELAQTHEDLNGEYVDLRLKKGAGDASRKPVRQRLLRRDMARIKTIIRERER